MIRTLTVVACLTLLAGLCMGFFVAQAKSAADRPGEAAPLDPVLEGRVRQYKDAYGLGPEETAEIRDTIREYDQKLLDLHRQLRARHQDEFRALADRANARIQAVLKSK